MQNRTARQFNRQRGLIAVFIAVVWIAAGRAALARDKNVTVYEIERGNSVLIVAKLDKCSEATITISGSLENMVSSQPMPFTAEVTGDQPKTLAILTPRDLNAPWNYRWDSYWKHGHRLRSLPATYIYSHPFKPALLPILQGPYGAFSHFAGSQDEEAIDWSMPVGTVIYPARPGTVIALRSDCTSGAPDTRLISEYNYVMIKHDDGTYAEYVHLAKDGVLVRLGDKVALSQPIALSGNTGYTTTPHLHFAVFYPVDGNTRTTVQVTFATDASVQ